MGRGLLQAALALAERDWTVLPTKPGTKEAAVRWKLYRTARPTHRLLERWFGSGDQAGGIAVLLGQASGNLVCRDFDEQDAYDRWAHNHPDLAEKLPTVKTYRGRHVYFTGPEGYQDLEDGEYRGDAGHYCLVPPSPHPKGGSYEWTVPLPPGELPVIPDPARAGLIPFPLSGGGNTEDSGGVREGEREPSVLPPSGISYPSVGILPSVLPPSLVAEFGEEAGRVILGALPEGPGRRHRAVFELVRRLKALPQYAEADSMALQGLVRAWHQLALPVIRTKVFEETVVDFVDGWNRVKFVAGTGPVDQLWDAAGAVQVPGAEDRSPGVRRLIALCCLLQRRAGGGTFFLACRTVGRLAGVTHVAAWRWLRFLEMQGVLVRISTGSQATRKANEYRFVAERVV